MTSYVITLVNGMTITTPDGEFLRDIESGYYPLVTVKGDSGTYHIPTASIVCVQEVRE